MTQGVMTPLTPRHHLQQHPRAGSQGVGIATLIFRYFLRYFSSTHRADLSRFRGTFHSFDPVGSRRFASRSIRASLFKVKCRRAKALPTRTTDGQTRDIPSSNAILLRVLRPAASLNCSPAKWVLDPTPEEPNLICPGCALASAIRSLMDFTPSEGAATTIHS